MDIVPELLADVQKTFARTVADDPKISRINHRIRDGTATLVDAHAYGERLGEILSKAYTDNLTPDRLPDRIYYNIANRIISPTMATNHSMVNSAAVEIQGGLDEAAGVGLQAIAPELPTGRIDGLIDKVAESETVEDAMRWLKEPIVNTTESFVDDFVRENASFRASAGMETKLRRILANGCCDWCAALGGVYDYYDRPDDIFRRHEYCRCVVTFESGKVRQDVWSKRKWTADGSALERRREAAIDIMSAQERQNVMERRERDELIQMVMNATGYSRNTARMVTNGKTIEQIQKLISETLAARQRYRNRG